MQSFHKKIILITGCSSGFGLLMAARLASKGHIVYASMRNLSKQQALLDEVKKRGGEVRVLALDVTKPDTIKLAVSQIKSECGSIDVLVNNAGFGVGGFFEDLSEQDVRDNMETNFFGVLNVTREVLPLMRNQGKGKIINISSIAGLVSIPALSSYNSSKWALEGFSESLYYELKPFGIQVVLVEPGSYRTSIFYENARYAKRFNDVTSPYYSLSQFLRKRIKDACETHTKNPERIACVVEKIIESKNVRLRYLTDFESKMRLFLKRCLPFSLSSALTAKIIFQGYKSEKRS